MSYTQLVKVYLDALRGLRGSDVLNTKGRIRGSGCHGNGFTGGFIGVTTHPRIREGAARQHHAISLVIPSLTYV
jgi:hypothetical protein